MADRVCTSLTGWCIGSFYDETQPMLKTQSTEPAITHTHTHSLKPTHYSPIFCSFWCFFLPAVLFWWLNACICSCDCIRWRISKERQTLSNRPAAPIPMFILLNEIFHQDYSHTLYIQNPNKAINHQRLQWASGNQNLKSRQESLYWGWL